ncbi:hypothetical protein Tco_0727558 [Tanacetum coccineum]|uniref:Uncharacterized protein n=1 Tax=Tanacetum coccineum TaxID=301880 RepID=A0ABQ4YL65_9ASTR
MVYLSDHVPSEHRGPEHPEDLVPAEDEAPTPLLPPSFLAPRIRPLRPKPLRGTPPLEFTYATTTPSTSRRADNARG